MSSTRKAVLPVIEAREALLFYPTLYEGFEYSRHCIYTGAAPNQNSVQLVDFLTKHYGKRVFLVGSNYVYPYESNRTISDLFLQLGGQVLDEIYVPLNLKPEDVAKIIRHIRAARPDVIYSTIVGDGIIPFYTAFKEAGFDSATMPIASQSTSEADVVRMRPEVAEGHITAAPFSPPWIRLARVPSSWLTNSDTASRCCRPRRPKRPISRSISMRELCSGPVATGWSSFFQPFTRSSTTLRRAL